MWNETPPCRALPHREPQKYGPVGLLGEPQLAQDLNPRTKDREKPLRSGGQAQHRRRHALSPGGHAGTPLGQSVSRGGGRRRGHKRTGACPGRRLLLQGDVELQKSPSAMAEGSLVSVGRSGRPGRRVQVADVQAPWLPRRLSSWSFRHGWIYVSMSLKGVGPQRPTGPSRTLCDVQFPRERATLGLG